MSDLLTLDALSQAELVRGKQISARELVEFAIARIEKFNPQVNAVITTLFEEARKQSEGNLPAGPFTGVPFLLKDLGALLKGVRWTAGSNFLKDYIPDHDSVLTERLRQAGLIFLGRTNTCELGQQPTTEPIAFGPTRNPWNLEHIAGGSSGGAAAAVAAGMVPMSHGNDGGGSIRIPASCCGVFGLKPTRGRITLSPDLGDILNGFVAEHALTRSVRDSAALLDATAGPDWGDPYFPPPPERPYLEECARPVGQLKIAWTSKAPNGVPVHADCIAALEDAVRLLTSLGHQVEEKEFKLSSEMLNHAFLVAWTSGAANAFANVARAAGREPKREFFEPFTWALRDWGLKHSAVDYLQAVRDLQFVSRQIMRHFIGHDVWLTPVLAEPPLKIGTLDSPPEDPLRGFFRAGMFCPFTPLANVTGQPAMSVPLFWNAEGLPIGVHVMGRYGDEATLFRLASQLEQARPWAERLPPQMK